MTRKKLLIIVGAAALAVGVAIVMRNCSTWQVVKEDRIKKKIEVLVKEDSARTFNAAKYADTALYYIGRANTYIQKRDSVRGDSSRYGIEIEDFESRVRGNVEKNYYDKLKHGEPK